MRIVLVISVWLLLAAVCLNFWDLHKKNEALIERMESLEQAVEQRDRDLKQAEEAWQQKRKALDDMEKADPDFYGVPGTLIERARGERNGNSLRKALERLAEPGHGVQNLRQLRQALDLHSLPGGAVLGF